ncbi:S41 family peptidase [Mucilaginibacter sp. RS28]|uniref:S41 family peptidase n=1 Tax=Mucilaginibacter straminoryzae TaxID=2932774 RepID=A0A9X1X4F1_9SPHI|nr:S41 family peptidase [Mucilaginibacter straminoryzae]MCJ8210351.1 S41 family peptidase [Mucilaginibacter straminoryzae]
MPQAWNSKETEGYTTSLTAEQKHSGGKSFYIRGASTLPASAYFSFSEITNIQADHLKEIAVTCYVKTSDLNGNVQLWCQVWDKNNKIISFQNSQMQNAELTGNNDWKKLTLKLTIAADAKRLLLGGFLMGSGFAWFDDFAIEEFSPVANARSNDQLLKFGKEVINIVKQNALYADSVDWSSVDKEMAELSKNVSSLDDAPIIADYVIGKLRKAGDKHSFFQSKINAQKYASGNSVQQQPYSKLLEGGIAYLSVPGFESTSNNASVRFAEQIQALIRELDTKQDVKGWIVDLRKDSGGNMYPMIAGLGPLIGEGTLGYFIDPKTKSDVGYPWFYNNGSSGANGIKGVTVKEPYQVKTPGNKIAVLAGAGTASSGEMTTVCFIGKHNVRLFGQPTAGFITANQGFKLSTGAYLYLATSYVADRNHKKYLVNIHPDVEVSDHKDQVADATLNAAINWLKN